MSESDCCFDLKILREMLKHVLYFAGPITDKTDGELIAMVRYIRDKRYEADAEVRRLEAIIRGPAVDE